MTTSRGLTVLERSVYRGPNLYSARAMVRVRLDIGALEDRPTNTLGPFNERLLDALPGLRNHGCSRRHAGGFESRLAEGTWIGHVIEHVALEIMTRAGAPVTRGKTRSVRGQAGVYDVLVSYQDEAAACLAMRLAIAVVHDLLPPEFAPPENLDMVAPLEVVSPPDPAGAIREVAAVVRRAALGPSTAALVGEARRRRIPVRRLNEHSLIQLGWGSAQRRLRASVTDATGLIAAEAAGDKAEAKRLLGSVGLPVARGLTVRTIEEAVEGHGRLTPPLVLKPLDGNHGRGVTTGILSTTDVAAAFDIARPHGRRFILEEQIPGRDYRILVVAGEVVAVAERQPPSVTGDGSRSISELVARVNEDPRRGVGHEGALTRIRLADPSTTATLGQLGYDRDTIPALGERVLLRATANLSAGGEAIDRTDDIHPENAAIARRAARVLGLDVAGIDLLAPDIRRSVRETGGGIVEVNAAPGLRMHLHPSNGQRRDVARPIIASLIPRGRSARIPVLAVTGTNGKSTVGRMVATVFAAHGLTVGLTNTSGVYIGDERVTTRDASGPKSARMVLADPTVDVAVLECARGGILREGLAFDRCDVGAVLNVQPDHIGLKGVESLEDLADVKSVVVENVSRRGVSVLNADDRLTRRMARHAGGRVCFFSMTPADRRPEFLVRHIEAGGLACVIEDGVIVIKEGGGTQPVCRPEDIPATFGGRVTFNIQNALAAAAMTFGAGLGVADIAVGLQRFSSSFEENPGRMNISDAHGFTAVLDYAHNPEALRALGGAIRRLTPVGKRSIAMVSIPGDRRDEEIRAMGAIGAEAFDVLVFRETPDRRGRAAGVVNALMIEGARSVGCDPSRIHAFHDEDVAAQAALDLAGPGDVVALMPTRVEAVWKMIEDFSPRWTQTALEPPHG